MNSQREIELIEAWRDPAGQIEVGQEQPARRGGLLAAPPEDDDLRAAEYQEASAWAAEMSMQADRERMCSECGQYPADYPSTLCQGCNAYQEHTSHD